MEARAIKRQKRWQSLESIDNAIDSTHKKILKFRREAQCCYDAMELLRGENDVEAKKAAIEGDRLIAKAARQENTRLKKLSALRAEFLTVPLGESAAVAGLNETAAVLRRHQC